MRQRTRMAVARNAFVGTAILAGLAVAGCGRSSTQSSPATTASSARSPGSPSGAGAPARSGARSKPARAVTIDVTIPVRQPSDTIPKRYTCHGADVSLPISWSGVPAGTAQLAVFVTPSVVTDLALGRPFFYWAVTGLPPAVHGISAGTLPAGAIVGRNSFGDVDYSLCPLKGAPERQASITRREPFVVKVYALPHPLAAKPGFDAEALYREAAHSATAVGRGRGFLRS